MSNEMEVDDEVVVVAVASASVLGEGGVAERDDDDVDVVYLHLVVVGWLNIGIQKLTYSLPFDGLRGGDECSWK